MTRLLAIAAAIGGLVLAAGPAVAERLVTSLSRHQVLVNSSFTGTSIVLFGTIEPDTPDGRRRDGYDLVVTVTGPRQNVVARRKERFLGIWTNVGSRTFTNVPSYLAVLSNQPIDQIADLGIARSQRLGLIERVLPSSDSGAPSVSQDDPFLENLIRLKTQHRTYLQRPNGVTFLTPTVFRAEIPLPAETPIGNYDVDVRVFANGRALNNASSAFEIVKVGFEQFVATAASHYGLLYGLATAMMAIMTGWFASVVFRRD